MDLYTWSKNNNHPMINDIKIIDLFDEIMNGKSVLNVSCRDAKNKYYWKCEYGEDHRYLSTVYEKTRESRKPTGCPYCTKGTQFATRNNNLKKYAEEHGRIDLINEFSTKNINPIDKYLPRTKQEVWWICPHCNDLWLCSPKKRIDDKKEHGCRIDLANSSLGQEIIYYVIKNDYKELKVTSRNKKFGNEIDILLSNDIKNLGIEYGSTRFHDLQGVINKVQDLAHVGVKLLTIFELKSNEELKLTYENDILYYKKKSSRDYYGLYEILKELYNRINVYFDLNVGFKYDYKHFEIMINTVYSKCKYTVKKSIYSNENKMRYWDWEKNAISPFSVAVNSNTIMINLKCPICGFEWINTPNSINKSNKDSGCKRCTGKGKEVWEGYNDFYTLYSSSDLSWYVDHYIGNKPLNTIRYASLDVLEFKCDRGHIIKRSAADCKYKKIICKDCRIIDKMISDIDEIFERQNKCGCYVVAHTKDYERVSTILKRIKKDLGYNKEVCDRLIKILPPIRKNNFEKWIEKNK